MCYYCPSTIWCVVSILYSSYFPLFFPCFIFVSLFLFCFLPLFFVLLWNLFFLDCLFFLAPNFFPPFPPSLRPSFCPCSLILGCTLFPAGDSGTEVFYGTQDGKLGLIKISKWVHQMGWLAACRLTLWVRTHYHNREVTTLWPPLNQNTACWHWFIAGYRIFCCRDEPEYCWDMVNEHRYGGREPLSTGYSQSTSCLVCLLVAGVECQFPLAHPVPWPPCKYDCSAITAQVWDLCPLHLVWVASLLILGTCLVVSPRALKLTGSSDPSHCYC